VCACGCGSRGSWRVCAYSAGTFVSRQWLLTPSVWRAGKSEVRERTEDSMVRASLWCVNAASQPAQPFRTKPLRGFVRRCYSPAPPSLTARLLGPASPSRQLPRSVVRRLSRYSLAVGRRSTGSASPHLWMEMWICRSAVVLRQRQPRAEMLPERGVGGGRRALPRRCDDLGGLPRLP
jgi:hypothetical protein